MPTFPRRGRARAFSLIDAVLGVFLLATLAAVSGPALAALVRGSQRQEAGLQHVMKDLDESALAQRL